MPPKSFQHLKSTQIHFLRLYAAVRRCHRVLPLHMRHLGNQFARSEFDQHKPGSVTDENLRQFFIEWTKYLKEMITQAETQAAQLKEEEKNDDTNNTSDNNRQDLNQGMNQFGKDLDIISVQGMTDEQLKTMQTFWTQLDELNNMPINTSDENDNENENEKDSGAASSDGSSNGEDNDTTSPNDKTPNTTVFDDFNRLNNSQK